MHTESMTVGKRSIPYPRRSVWGKKQLEFRVRTDSRIGKDEAGEAHSNSLGCLLETMMSRILFFAALLGQLVNSAHGFLAATFVLRLARHAGKVGNTNLRRYSSRPCSRARVGNL